MKQIAVDILAQVLGKIFSSVIGLLAITQICRYLSVEDFGGYTLAFSFLTFFYPLVDMGLNIIASREVAKNPERIHSILSEVFCIKIILTILALLAILLLTSLLGYSATTRSLIFVASFSLFNTVIGTIEIALIARHRLFLLALSQFFSSSIFLFLVYGLINFGRGTAALIAAQVFSVFLSYVMVLLAIRGTTRLTKPSWSNIVSLFHQAFPLGIASLMVACYFNIDLLMLSKLMDESAVAYYGAAVRLLSFIAFIPHAVMMSLFPALSRSRQQEEKCFQSIFSFIFYILMLIIIPGAIWVTYHAKPIIELIYTQSYQPSVHAFQIIIWSGLGIFASYLSGHTLVILGKQKFSIFISCIAAICNVILNYFLIPKYGINGAAIATVITEILVALLGFSIIANYEKIIPFSMRMINVFVVMLATFLLSLASRESNWFASTALFLFFWVLSTFYLIFKKDHAMLAKFQAIS